MQYKIAEHQYSAVIRIKGTVLGGPEKVAFLQELQGLLGRRKVCLVFDLSRARYFSSAGIGMLVTSLKHARAAGGDLRLARLNPQLREVLRMTNLHTIFAEYPTPEEALRSYGPYGQ